MSPELERAILRRPAAGQELLGELGSHGDLVRAPETVERGLQDVRPDPRIVDVTRERDRLGCQRLPPGAIVLVEQFLRLEREQLGGSPHVGAVVERDGTFDRLHPLVVELADQAGEAARVGKSGGCGEIGIAERRGDPGGLQQRLPVRRVADQLLRLAEADQRAAAVGVVDLAEQLERVGEQLRGVRRREALERPPSGTR